MDQEKEKASKKFALWTNAKCLELLAEFYRQAALWDPRNQYYFNMTEKEKAWDEISKTMGQSKVECKRKMESLKGSFRRERSRLNRSKKEIGKDIYHSKWFAYEAMQFLDERADPRSCYSNPPPELFGEIRLIGDKPEFIRYDVLETSNKDSHWENNKTEHESDVDLDDDDDTPINCEPFPVVSVDEPILEPYEPYNNQRSYSEISGEQIPVTVIVPSSPSEGSLADITETTITQANQSPRREEKASNCACKDECTIYGQHVANKLRKLDDKSRALVQHKINTLLFKAEMKMFDGDENV